MSTSLITALAVLISGGAPICNSRVCNIQKIQKVQQVVAQKVVAQPVVAQQYQAVVPAAIITYQMQPQNQIDARLSKLEEIAEQNAQLMQYLSQAGPGGTGYQHYGTAPMSTVEQAGRGILNRHCASCHSGTDPSAGLDLTGTLSLPQRLLAYSYMETGEMPPNLPDGKTIPVEDIVTFSQWVDEGRDEYRSMLRESTNPSQANSTLLGP